MIGRLTEQEVQNILDAPFKEIKKDIKKTSEERIFSTEAKVMSHGREYDRGKIETMRHVYENLKMRKVGCQLLTEFKPGQYVILEEYIR